MLKPAMLNKNGKIYLAVPPSIYRYFVNKQLDSKCLIVLDHLCYVDMEMLSDPDLQEYLRQRISPTD